MTEETPQMTKKTNADDNIALQRQAFLFLYECILEPAAATKRDAFFRLLLALAQ